TANFSQAATSFTSKPRYPSCVTPLKLCPPDLLISLSTIRSDEVIAVLQLELRRPPVAPRLVGIVGVVRARRVHVLEEALERRIQKDRAPARRREQLVDGGRALDHRVRRVVAKAQPPLERHVVSRARQRHQLVKVAVQD